MKEFFHLEVSPSAEDRREDVNTASVRIVVWLIYTLRF